MLDLVSGHVAGDQANSPGSFNDVRALRGGDGGDNGGSSDFDTLAGGTSQQINPYAQINLLAEGTENMFSSVISIE
jgi:hypothetical protein